MKKKYAFLGGICALATAQPLLAQGATVATDGAAEGEIIVTAQKRAESIEKVGMSIDALSGNDLEQRRITEVTDLQKVVTGFSAVQSAHGTPIFTIRGIGFQDHALAAAPTVSTYVDEAPLPFSVMTAGATLDLERVEVLKGPQGTLFGQNATGGAINFIAKKPTDNFEWGGNVTAARFGELNVAGYVSGPLAENLDYRIAFSTTQGGAWQKSYTRPDKLGTKNFINGRASLLWRATDRLKILATISGFRDRSETQAQQLFGIHPRTSNPLPAAFLSYPLAPKSNRAADWSLCIATNAINDECTGYEKNNRFLMGTVRIDYELTDEISLTSLTAYQRFKRYEPLDLDGTTFENYGAIQFGSTRNFSQELRLAGTIANGGNWIVGGNYSHDKANDFFYQKFRQSTSSSAFGLPLADTTPTNNQRISTYAIFANVDYPILDTVSLQLGGRYTKQDRRFEGCNRDSGDGNFSAISRLLTNFALTGNPFAGPAIDPGAGNCSSINGAPTFAAGLINSSLNEDNVSWRAGLNWKPTSRSLLYANVSHGYKSGSYPTIAASLNLEYRPVKQEDLLAYELGFKLSLLDNRLKIDGAAFYYDYSNKQVIGNIDGGVFGPLQALVNIPKSRVLGFEFGASWRPIDGLTLAPSVSLADSQIKGNFTNFDPFGGTKNFSGEEFPLAPRWQASGDAEYKWPLRDGLNAFMGASMSYQGSTNAGLGQLTEFDVPSYTVFDLRAGVESDNWSLQLWAKNVTDKYYWTSAYWGADALNRYTGQPRTFGVTFGYNYR